MTLLFSAACGDLEVQVQGSLSDTGEREDLEVLARPLNTIGPFYQPSELPKAVEDALQALSNTGKTNEQIARETGLHLL